MNDASILCWVLTLAAIPFLAIGLRSVLRDLFRAAFPDLWRARNYRRPGTRPRDTRGDGLQARATIMAGQMLGDRSRRGWSTRRRKIEALRRARMDADIKACLAMDGGPQ